MHLITNPRRFDVLLTENLFGDILSEKRRLSRAHWACWLRPPLAETSPLRASAWLGPGHRELGVANPFGR